MVNVRGGFRAAFYHRSVFLIFVAPPRSVAFQYYILPIGQGKRLVVLNVVKMLVALGQATWMPGQLEYEIQNNFWLTLPINYDIIFETPSELRYDAALEQFGFNSYQLVGNAARA